MIGGQIDCLSYAFFCESILKPLKVLNLYAGIGGNRKLWQNVEVTAVEQNAEIAKIYSDFFPDDKMIVGDAHQYLLEHFAEYDFIWSSPPCQSHSKMNHSLKGQGIYRFPDMKLYEEIIFLQHFASGLWVVENVQPYYDILIPAKSIGRHLFWSNFFIPDIIVEYKIETKTDRKAIIREAQIPELLELHGLTNFKLKNKRQVLRNCVIPNIGLHVLQSALGTIPPMPLGTLFENDESKKYA